MIELVGDELYQWDTGRKVKITPKRGYTISCVHFNDGSEKSLTMVNGVATAMIPDKLLEQCGSVTVYAVHTGEKLIETTESRQFYIKKKTKPTGYTHVQEEVVTINSAITAKNIMVGEHGAPDNPDVGSALFKAKSAQEAAQTYAGNARDSATSASTSANSANDYKTAAEKAKNEILGNGGTYVNPKDNSALKEIRSAKTEIVGKTGTAKSPNDNSALKEIRNTKTEILGETGTYKEPSNNSALKEIRDFTKTGGSLAQAKKAAQDAAGSRDAIRSIESNMNTAVEAAGQIDSFRSEITTYHTETKNARNDILSKGADGEKSVYEKIIDAETSIIGSGGTVDKPKEGSALRATKDAQKAAEDAAEEAKEAATNANQGIKVVDALDNTSKVNALSANKGKELNESKLNLSGGTMTGTLKLNGDPSNSNDAATKNYVDTQIAKKVDKVDGKGLSTNDYTNADKVKLDGLENVLAAKVDKEDGKGLSTNDFTTNEKTKLAGLENYTLPTASDKVKGGIKVGAGLTMNGEVLSATGGGTADAVDWSNVTNKPKTFAPSTHTHTASEVTELATVATSGSYNDLSDKPTDFAPAAHTHEMTDITGLSDALDGKSDTTHNHDGTYLKSVPIATKEILGGIKVGTGLSVTTDGILSADAQAINVTPLITQNSDEAVSSGAVFSRIGNLKFVVSPTPPTDADGNTFTIVVPN